MIFSGARKPRFLKIWYFVGVPPLPWTESEVVAYFAVPHPDNSIHRTTETDMFERRSLKWPILLAVTMIILLVGLIVGWILLSVGMAIQSPSRPFYWVLLSAGTAMFVCVVVGVVLYLRLSIQQIHLTRRQSNFIDSVTHELKSPIASLKLYLQTLGRRTIAEEQRLQFYRSMLADVDRLDQLINHLLDAARLDRQKESTEDTDFIRLDALLEDLLMEVAKRYEIPDENIEVQLLPVEVMARAGQLNVVFRNLLDNAAKYAGQPPKISVFIHPGPKVGWVRVSIQDNGSGIPRQMRRQIFGRFVRLGNELERTKPGTGLGLYLVRSVLKQLRGKISLADLPKQTGTRFDVLLRQALIVQNEGESSVAIDPNVDEHRPLEAPITLAVYKNLHAVNNMGEEAKDGDSDSRR